MWMRRAGGLLATGLLLGPLAVRAADPAVEFTDAERARIVALGPWPMATVRDPSNRVSGQPRAIDLGRRLFFDPRMSPIGYVACVSCHAPDRAFADLKSRAHGLADLERNTIALANLRLQRWYGWGGSSDSLWMASLRPILDPREFDGSAASATRLFRRDAELAHCYRTVFGEPPTGDEERVLVNVGKALAAFLETLQTGRTPFDDIRDALARGTAVPVAYPATARRGLRLFVGRAGCIECHNGPNFSDGDFHATGAPPPIAPAPPDLGRADGRRLLAASRYNLSGHFSDAPRRPFAAAYVAQDSNGAFRTPSLRNVAVTAPYMHNGRVETLDDAIRQHAITRTIGGSAPDDGEVADLVAFLRTLTDADGERRHVAVSSNACPP
jgi:cytochrome c peroxidase